MMLVNLEYNKDMGTTSGGHSVGLEHRRAQILHPNKPTVTNIRPNSDCYSDRFFRIRFRRILRINGWVETV
jgi:hypothetical protein